MDAAPACRRPPGARLLRLRQEPADGCALRAQSLEGRTGRAAPVPRRVRKGGEMTAIAALQIWAATPLAHGLGLALLHFLWEGAVVAAALAILLAAVRSARARYAVAVSALMALPLVFAITWAVCARPTGAVLPAPHAPYLYRLPIALPAGNSIPAPPPDRLTWLVPLWMAGVGICYARSFTAWFAAQRLRRRG